jgi:hypothetical protein
MEYKASSTQRFDLRLFDEGGMRRIRIHPFQNTWSVLHTLSDSKHNTQGTTMSANLSGWTAELLDQFSPGTIRLNK